MEFSANIRKFGHASVLPGGCRRASCPSRSGWFCAAAMACTSRAHRSAVYSTGHVTPVRIVAFSCRLNNAAASFANPFGPDLTFPQFPAYSPTTARGITFIDQGYRPARSSGIWPQRANGSGTQFMLEMAMSAIAARIRSESIAEPSAVGQSFKPDSRTNDQHYCQHLLRVPIQGFTLRASMMLIRPLRPGTTVWKRASRKD